MLQSAMNVRVFIVTAGTKRLDQGGKIHVHAARRRPRQVAQREVAGLQVQADAVVEALAGWPAAAPGSSACTSATTKTPLGFFLPAQ